MTERLTIQAPDQPARTQLLTDDVYRVGHAADCGIQVRSAGPHALTVFRKEGQLFVRSRTREACALGRRRLSAGAVVEWRPGVTLQLSGTRLTLASRAAAPTPSSTGAARRVSRDDRIRLPADETQSSARTGNGTGKTPRERRQLMVIVGCVLLTGLMLWTGSLPAVESGPQQLNEPTAKLMAILSEPRLSGVRRAQVERLLELLNQCRIAIALDQRPLAELAQSEAQAFCESLLRADNGSSAEHQVFRDVNDRLRRLETSP